MTKGIIGAVIGDIIGSSRESKPVSRKNFKLFTKQSNITDDSVLTIAVAEWMLDKEHTGIADSLKEWARKYPHAGYGSSFKRFWHSEEGITYYSTHNGAVMRVSSVGYLASSLNECMELAKQSAMPSHGSDSAIAAAQAAAVAIYLAREGRAKEEIQGYIESTFGYDLHRTYDQVRSEVLQARANRDIDYEASHERIVGAEPSVQDAIIAFLAGDSYEDVVRNAIYFGGDADTEAAIAGSIAAAYYGVPEKIIQEALIYIPSDLLAVINKVDGTSWQPSKLIPPKSSRWSKDDVVIYGCSKEDENIFEKAGYLTRPSKYHRHYNEGYPVHVTGLEEERILDEIWVLRRKCESSKHIRWHLHEIGMELGGFTQQRFRELFGWALELDNVLVTPTLLY